MAAGVSNFDMAYTRMIGKGGGEQRLDGATISAPRAAKLEYGGPVEHVDLRARWFDRRIHFVHRHRIAGCLTTKLSGRGSLVKAATMPHDPLARAIRRHQVSFLTRMRILLT